MPNPQIPIAHLFLTNACDSDAQITLTAYVAELLEKARSISGPTQGALHGGGVAAIESLALHLALELGNRGININVRKSRFAVYKLSRKSFS